MIAAAQRRVDRQQARLEQAREIVTAGVAAQSYLLPLQQELTLRQTSLDLAQLRAHLMAEGAAMNAAPKVPAIPEALIDDPDLFDLTAWSTMKATARSMNRAIWRRWSWRSKAGSIRPLPISAKAKPKCIARLGFDHRGRVDVAVDPNQPGRRLAAPILEAPARFPITLSRMRFPGRPPPPTFTLAPEARARQYPASAPPA